MQASGSTLSSGSLVFSICAYPPNPPRLKLLPPPPARKSSQLSTGLCVALRVVEEREGSCFMLFVPASLAVLFACLSQLIQFPFQPTNEPTNHRPRRATRPFCLLSATVSVVEQSHQF